jgi:hypothetical protein
VGDTLLHADGDGQIFVTVIIGFILLVVEILYFKDWAVVLQLTGIEG